MSFPQVLSTTPSVFSSFSTTHNVAMPAAVEPGDLLICLIATLNSVTVTTPAGWDFKGAAADATGNAKLWVYTKDAVGDEDGGTVNFATSGVSTAAAQVYRIDAGTWYGDTTNGFAISSFGTGASVNPDSPSLNPSSWDVEDTTWLTVFGGFTGAAVSNYPASYTDGVLTNTVLGSLDMYLGSARRQNAVAAENPGAFTIGSLVGWVATTLAIRQTAAVPLDYDGFEDVEEFGDFDFDFITAIHYDGFEDVDEFGDYDFQGIPFRWSLEHLEARTDYGFPTVWVEVSGLDQPTGSFPTGKFFERRILELPRLDEAELDSRFGIAGFQRVTLTVDNSDGLLSGHDLQDTYVRMFFVDAEGDVYREFKGKVTEWTLSHRCVLSVEDVDAIAITQDLPRRTINALIEAEKTADVNFENVVVANDLGNPIPVIFGRAVKVPLLYVKADETNREYDYIIGEGEGLNGNNFQDVFTVYRNDQALDDIEGTAQSGSSASALKLETGDQRPNAWYKYWWVEITSGPGAGSIRHVTNYDSATNIITPNSNFSATLTTSSHYRLTEWRFFDGSQASPYAGYAFTRFKKRMGVSGSTDPIYADVNGFGDETNIARAVQSLVSNPDWGLGLDVDTASFDAAAGISGVLAMLCEGAITDTVAAVDILNELLGFRDMVLSKDDEIRISVDQAKTSARGFGLGDETGWNNILTASPEILHIHPNEKVKNLKVRYRKNFREGDVYQYELERLSSVNGVDTTVNLPFVYDHATADRWLDYKRKRFAAAVRRMSLEVGQDGRDAARGELASISIPSLGMNSQGWEITGTGVTPAGANSLSLVPYSAAPYAYVPFTSEGGTLPVDESFDIPPDYTQSIPDPVTGVSVTMSMGIVGFTAHPFALITWTPPEDNYSGAVVSVKLHSDATTLFRAVGTYSTSARIEGLVPGQLYDFLIESLNVTGEFKGLGQLFNGTGSGYLAGGDNTAPATPTGLVGSSKFGKLIWTWNKNTEADVAYYEAELNTSTSGGVLGKEIIPHLDDADFKPRYELEIQTGDLNTSITRALRVRAKDHSGNPASSSAGWTSRIAASTGSILQDDVTDDEITNKARATVSSITLFPSGTTIISANITKRSGTRIRIAFSMAIESGSGFGAWSVELRRNGGIIQDPWASTFVPSDGAAGVSAVYDDNVTSSGTFTYSIVLNFGASANTGRNLNLMLLELRR